MISIFDTKWKQKMRMMLILMVVGDFISLTEDEIHIYVRQLAECMGIDDIL